MAGLVLPITQAEWGEDFDLSELYDNEPKANDVTAFGPAPDSIGQATGAPAIVASEWLVLVQLLVQLLV
jgi:hypothetical protein